MGAPYTGPTGVQFTGTSLHIEGYPDATHVVRLGTRTGRRLEDMRLHQSDLLFCQRTTQTYGTAVESQSDDLAVALWVAILTKFYSCFGQSKSRSSLDPKAVFGATSEAMVVFNYYKNIRNKHIVHDENNHNYCYTGIVFGPNLEIQDIISLKIQTVSYSLTDGQNVINLVDIALKYVAQEVSSMLREAFAEAANPSPAERAALPTMEYRVRPWEMRPGRGCPEL